MINMMNNNPDAAFVVVSTAITILILLLRLFLKFRMLLWKSTLISYIVFVVFILMGVVYEHCHMGPFYRIVFHTLSAILLSPPALIYGLVPGAIKMCPSEFDFFAILTTGFLFYAFIFWGIMKVIKQRKEIQTAEKKQDDNVEKQPPSGTYLKGV